MRDQLGSHWRWRLLLLLALVLTVAGERSQSPQWRLMIASGGGKRIVATSERRDHVTVMATDETTGRFRDCLRIEFEPYPAYFRVVHEGTAVAWQQMRELHVGNLDAPHRTKSWPIPQDVGWSIFEGFSSDERFAVFQKPMQINSPAPAKTANAERRYLISVVDLSSGQIVSAEEWAGPIESTGKPNEFRGTKSEDSANESEPIDALWKLTATGQWERIESTSLPSFDRYQRVRLAESPQGSIRRLADDEKPTPSETEIAGAVAAVSPSGHILIDRAVKFQTSVLIGRQDTARLLRTDAVISYHGISFPNDDAAAVVIPSDDIEVLDLNTGKALTTFYFGTHRQKVLTVFAIWTVVLVGMWTWLGARERSSWWMFDAPLAMVTLPLAHLTWFAANFQARMMGSAIYVFGHMGFIAGIIAGVSIVVGWYWTYGHGRTAIRWIVGGILLCAVSAYLCQQVVDELLGATRSTVEGMTLVWAACQSASIVLAGVGAVLLLATKTFGWTVSDAPLDQPIGQFSLASLFVATIGISMIFAIAKAASSELNLQVLWFILASALAVLLIGNLVVSLILSRSIWAAAIHAMILLILLPAIWITAEINLGAIAWLPVAGAHILGSFLGGALLPIVIGSGLARCHGWRWMRASRAIEPPPEMEAARESIESAPQSADVGNQPVLN